MNINYTLLYIVTMVTSLALLLMFPSFTNLQQITFAQTNESSEAIAGGGGAGRTEQPLQGQEQQQGQEQEQKNQTDDGSGLNRTGFTDLTNIIINDKTYPTKYNITGGKLLGAVADEDRSTLVMVLAPGGNGGKLVVEMPRNALDAKGQGNEDSKFEVKIDDKGVEYKELGNSLKARIMEIDFSKDNRLIEIAGTGIGE
jgi:hypothetical protein